MKHGKSVKTERQVKSIATLIQNVPLDVGYLISEFMDRIIEVQSPQELDDWLVLYPGTTLTISSEFSPKSSRCNDEQFNIRGIGKVRKKRKKKTAVNAALSTEKVPLSELILPPVDETLIRMIGWNDRQWIIMLPFKPCFNEIRLSGYVSVNPLLAMSKIAQVRSASSNFYMDEGNALATILKKQSIESLSIQIPRKKRKPGSYLLLLEAIENSQSLKELTIVESDGKLIPAMMKNTSITKLSATGGLYLLRTCMPSLNIQQLVLDISSENCHQVHAFLQVASECASLRCVTLESRKGPKSFNGYGQILIAFLRNNPYVQSITINGVGIGGTNILQLFADMLEQNGVLNSVHLSNTLLKNHNAMLTELVKNFRTECVYLFE